MSQAVEFGAVVIDEDTRVATIVAPPNSKTLTDVEWLIVLTAAGEIGRELEALGYTVRY